MSTFLFVHDSFAGAWCWERVLPLMRANGHLAEAIDLPAHGRDRTPVDLVGPQSYVARIDAAIQSSIVPVNVVAHGSAGIWVAEAAKHAFKNIARIIYICAVARAHLTSESAPLISIALQDAREALYHDCAWDAPDAIARLRPSPAAPLREAPILTGAGLEGIPRDYILCSNDRVVTAEIQAEMAEEFGCERIVEMRCGHSPFYAYPKILAAHLVTLAASSSLVR